MTFSVLEVSLGKLYSVITTKVNVKKDETLYCNEKHLSANDPAYSYPQLVRI